MDTSHKLEIHAHACTHARTHARTHTHAQTHVHTRHTHTHTHTHEHTHASTHLNLIVVQLYGLCLKNNIGTVMRITYRVRSSHYIIEYALGGTHSTIRCSPIYIPGSRAVNALFIYKRSIFRTISALPLCYMFSSRQYNAYGPTFQVLAQTAGKLYAYT